MRRQRTRTTAWPAVADLMTVFAVLGLASAAIVRHQTAAERSKAEAQQMKIESLEATVDELQATVDELRIAVVGFRPCWRGKGPDEPQYFLTYNVTISPDARFSMEPHGDWREGSDLRGRLAPDLVNVLLEYPAEPVRGAGLRDFGAGVEAVVVGTGDYEPNCELAVTVNGTATVAEAAVVRRAGFYPVGRD